MLSIRLKRMGAKKHPFYRVVISESTRCTSGRCLAEVGSYDPGRNPAVVKLDLETIKTWMARGARPSDTVRSLLGRA